MRSHSEVQVSSWHEFQSKIQEVEDKAKELDEHGIPVFESPLYRGQADSAWEVQSTLERFILEHKYAVPCESLAQYLSYGRLGVPTLEAFTDQVWERLPLAADLMGPRATEESLATVFSTEPELGSFLAYLRQYGFPSPLVDWTYSHYIAAFFACQGPVEGPDFAVHCLVRQRSRAGWVSAPVIVNLNPTKALPRRHFLQQGAYTVAVQHKADGYMLCPHREALQESSATGRRGFYKKITIPGGLRTLILAELDKMNIHPYSLFESTEALLRTLTQRHMLDHRRIHGAQS